MAGLHTRVLAFALLVGLALGYVIPSLLVVVAVGGAVPLARDAVRGAVLQKRLDVNALMLCAVLGALDEGLDDGEEGRGEVLVHVARRHLVHLLARLVHGRGQAAHVALELAEVDRGLGTPFVTTVCEFSDGSSSDGVVTKEHEYINDIWPLQARAAYCASHRAECLYNPRAGQCRPRRMVSSMRENWLNAVWSFDAHHFGSIFCSNFC